MLRRGLIITNGTIYTFDPENPRANGLLALDGRIEYVGDELDPEEMGIQEKRGAGWMTVIDLEGKTLMPGFIDSHTHLLLYAKSLREIDLRRTRSLSAVLEAMRARAKDFRTGVWLIGRGWNVDRWTDSAIPNRRELDSLNLQNPVLLYANDEHAIWVNTLAMKVAGITRETENPPGGVIVRDPATGEPTGIFKETAVELITKALPESTFGLQRDLMANALREVVRRGITTVYDHDGAASLQVLSDLQAGGLLPIRVMESFRASSLEGQITAGIVPGFGNDFLRLGGLKLFLDGSLSSRTAWMWDPYEDGSGSGEPQWSKKDLSVLVLRASAAKVPLLLHAIGDRAVSTALDLLEEYRQREPHPRFPHRIEHAQTIREEDFARFAKLGVVASMQPVHLLDDWEAAQRALGSRIENTFPARRLLDSGAAIAFGSDLPIASFDPLLGVYASVKRRRPDGTPREGFAMEQALTMEDAFRAYTFSGAGAMGLADKIGKLTEGLAADCVVLSKDPFKAPIEELLSIHVETTIVDGRVVYDRRGMPRRESF